ncbi:hypothetical protein KAFR_0I01900 [Kazachstania africana CBS 2517]|uniref:Uncharacterized protein n=1 Tax=Kazachstania africana (strain ATCC 22294 / BCRC 22015 / CBS 2517 / CECT 1963 / NBRC 1671 / NRRL Y-8276) TaxID=1071382 RepID=H2B020_KAZAF|nr:hypothetical protein KAFR_0I01900 [Kazachstania africana CBS 2517]CCF59970.1 hypothetical protein KAFR_0I01900 [Kazachstania africana CBS 2517]
MFSQDMRLLLYVFALSFITYYGIHRTVMNRYKFFVPNLQ